MNSNSIYPWNDILYRSHEEDRYLQTKVGRSYAYNRAVEVQEIFSRFIPNGLPENNNKKFEFQMLLLMSEKLCGPLKGRTDVVNFLNASRLRQISCFAKH